MFANQLSCCVPGCVHRAARVGLPECTELMCEAPYALASPSAQARRARREERLRSLQQCWNDEAYFGAVSLHPNSRKVSHLPRYTLSLLARVSQDDF